MIKYHVKIKNKTVHKTKNKNEALRIIAKIFRDGHEEVSFHGGRIGKWWNK